MLGELAGHAGSVSGSGDIRIQRDAGGADVVSALDVAIHFGIESSGLTVELLDAEVELPASLCRGLGLDPEIQAFVVDVYECQEPSAYWRTRNLIAACPDVAGAGAG